VCGESLPPDHFYCREHAAGVDERLQEIGELLGRTLADLPRLASLLDQVAPETWDYLTETRGDADSDWPLVPSVELAVHADEVDVDIDTEPGRVRIRLDTGLPVLVRALADGLARTDSERMAEACRTAEGANATH
jgi:hypothetical protein